MKWLIMHLSFLILGILLVGMVLVYEINGITGFLLATLGVLLIVIGLTLKGLVKLFANFLWMPSLLIPQSGAILEEGSALCIAELGYFAGK